MGGSVDRNNRLVRRDGRKSPNFAEQREILDCIDAKNVIFQIVRFDVRVLGKEQIYGLFSSNDLRSSISGVVFLGEVILGQVQPSCLGLWSVIFAVESLDDPVARLCANGTELVSEVVQYEDKYRPC
jgi:hypothetical protein